MPIRVAGSDGEVSVPVRSTYHMAGVDTSSRSSVRQYDPGVPEQGRHATRATRVRWYVTVFVVLLCFLDYLFRTNLSVATPTVIRSLGITEVQLGLAFMAFS